jgi:pilus assembly protein Flp/PilA
MLFSPKEKGQGLVEYALILVLIAIVVLIIMGLLGNQVSTIFSQITSALR